MLTSGRSGRVSVGTNSMNREGRGQGNMMQSRADMLLEMMVTVCSPEESGGCASPD